MGYVEEMTGCRLVATIPDSGVVVKSKWADGEPMSAHYMQQVFTPAENGRVLASVTEGYAFIIGTALVQMVPCGKGAIWLLGTLPDSKDLQKLMAMVCAEAGIEVPEVTGTVTVIPRSGENRQGLILMETACAPASYRLPEPMTDLLTGTTYAGTVELKPYDLMILEPKI
jgi:beta-galactosidase GanA